MAEFDFSTLVTNRSAADLETLRDMLASPVSDWTAEELARFNQAASKGAYNYTDLNRVTACMDYLNEVLTGLGYETGYQRIQVPHEEGGGRLPSGYTELLYIQSTGKQWIDTDVIPTQEYTLYTKASFLDTAGTNILGTRNGSGDTTNRFGLISFGSTSLFGAFYGTNSVSGNVVDQNTHEFSIGPDGFVMDGTTVNVQQTNFSCSYPIILFGFNNGSNGITAVSERIYSCKIYFEDQLIRDFVPCINPDGIIGLYDEENAVFYQNSGSGNFLKGPELVALPSGYKQLEYIQSNGTQYINTGFQPNQNTRVTTAAYLTAQDAGAWLFGARNSNAVATFGFLTYENAYRSDYNTDQNKSIPATYSDPFDIDKNKNQTQINGETEATSTAGTFQCNYPLILFGNNTGGNISGFGSGKIYQLSIYDNGTLVRNFIPCQNPDSEIGLYDTENSQFYGNAGAGAFIAGPEVPQTEPEPTLDPYTWYETDIPTASQMEQYLENVVSMRTVLRLPDDTASAPPDMVKLTQNEANSIENILGVLWIYLTAMQTVFLRSGATVCGGPWFYFVN